MHDQGHQSGDHSACLETPRKYLRTFYITKDKKQCFKMELPRLEGVDGNRLKIVPGGIERLLNVPQRSPLRSL